MTEKMWCIVNRHGNILWGTISLKRTAAIGKLADGSLLTWRQWRRMHGCRAVHCTVTVEE